MGRLILALAQDRPLLTESFRHGFLAQPGGLLLRCGGFAADYDRNRPRCQLGRRLSRPLDLAWGRDQDRLVRSLHARRYQDYQRNSPRPCPISQNEQSAPDGRDGEVLQVPFH